MRDISIIGDGGGCNVADKKYVFFIFNGFIMVIDPRNLIDRRFIIRNFV